MELKNTVIDIGLLARLITTFVDVGTPGLLVVLITVGANVISVPHTCCNEYKTLEAGADRRP